MFKEKLQFVSIGKIKVGAFVLRMEVEDAAIDDLVSSIRRVGILVPLIVCSEGDQYNLIAGHRRYVAAMRIGLAEVPCIIRDSSEAESSEVAFAENLFRQDLSAVETASRIKDILDQRIMELPELARAMHRSEHWVKSQLDLLSWPDDVLQLIHLGYLSVAAASNLALVTDDTYRDFLLKNAHENGATARTTAAWLQAWRSQAPPAAAVEAEPLPTSENPLPAVPQAPCIVCSQLFRTDGLAMVMACPACITAIRGVSS